MLSAIVIEKEMGSKAALTDDHVNGGAMLNVNDSLLILPSLLLLILSVGGLNGLVSMGRCKWVEYPHIKKRTLPRISPESKGFHI